MHAARISLGVARPRVRPRFVVRSELPPAEIRRRVNELVKSNDRFRGIAFDHRIELSIAGPEHHFWSPQLVCAMRPADEGAIVEARFGPDPYVWALYLFATGAAALVTAWALLFGLVQFSLGQTPNALYASPVLAVIGGLVYGASFVGQGLGAEQMYFLRTTLVDVCEAAGTEG